ncbi:MAG: hypothetical protein AAGA64_01255 [Bacteroidota bacterium]
MIRLTKYYFLHLLVILVFSGCDTEGNSDPRFEDYFIKYFGGDGNQTGLELAEYNEGFVLIGNNTLINGTPRLFVVHTDNIGNEIWARTYGGDSEMAAVDVEIDNDNNIIIAADLVKNDGLTDIVFFKLGEEGNKIDSLVYGFPEFDESAADLTITENNDYIITGYTTNVDIGKSDYDETTDFEDILSIRVNSNLQLFQEANWRRVYGFSGLDRGQGLVQKSDGTFLFFGTTDRFPPGAPVTSNPELNIFVFPAGQDGVVTSVSPFQWLGSAESDETAASITQTSNQGFVLAGTSLQSNATSSIYLASLRNDDELIFNATLGSVNNAITSSVIEDVNGGFLISGIEIVNNASNIFLMKTTNTGVVEWVQSFGGSDDDRSGSIIQLNDGSILMTGTIELESQTKMVLIKTKPNGELKP